jgi:hypothetical protein
LVPLLVVWLEDKRRQLFFPICALSFRVVLFYPTSFFFHEFEFLDLLDLTPIDVPPVPSLCTPIPFETMALHFV